MKRDRLFFRLLGLAILAYLFSKIDLCRFFGYLKSVNIWLFLVAIVLNFPIAFIKAIRWRWILISYGARLPVLEAVLVFLSASFAGYFTPGRIGEMIRAVYLKSSRGVPLTVGVSSVIIGHFLDLSILVCFGIMGMCFLGLLDAFSMEVSVILFGAFCIVAFFLRKGFLKVANIVFILPISFARREKLKLILKKYIYLIVSVSNRKLLLFYGLTLLSYLLLFIQCYILVVAMNIQLSFIDIIFLMSVASLISNLPISISGIGTRDAFIVYFFSMKSLPAAIGLSFSFLILIVLYVFNVLVSGIVWIFKPLTLKNLKNDI